MSERVTKILGPTSIPLFDAIDRALDVRLPPRTVFAAAAKRLTLQAKRTLKQRNDPAAPVICTKNVEYITLPVDVIPSVITAEWVDVPDKTIEARAKDRVQLLYLTFPYRAVCAVCSKGIHVTWCFRRHNRKLQTYLSVDTDTLVRSSIYRVWRLQRIRPQVLQANIGVCTDHNLLPCDTCGFDEVELRQLSARQILRVDKRECHKCQSGSWLCSKKPPDIRVKALQPWLHKTSKFIAAL